MSQVSGLPESWLWDHQAVLSREHRYLNVRDSLLSKVFPEGEIAEGLWITNFQGDNYFHWITEALPRLLLARRAGITFPVLLPRFARNRSFVKESLELLEEHWLELQSHTRYRLGKLILTAKTATGGNPRPDSLQQVRTALLSSAAKDTAEDKPFGRTERIWVTRRSAGRRRLLNESSLTKELEKEGFIVVDPGTLSLKEQMALFSGAKIIAGVHGAGLTNMIFMSPGSKVIEVRSRGDSHNNCYFAMASGCEHSYSYLLAESTSRKKHPDLVFGDIGEAMSTIHRMLEK